MHFLRVSWYSLVTRGTRCAQESMSSYNTCDHFGLKYMRQPATCALEPNTLVPDRHQERKPAGRPMDVF